MKNTKFFRRAMCMLLALIMVVSIVPASLLVIAEEDYSHLIGYWVEFNKDSFYMYKEPGSGGQGFYKSELPEYLEILDVKTAYYGTSLRVYYKLGLIDDATTVNDFYTHTWIWEKDVNLVEPPKPETNPEGYIEGQVGLVMDGEVVTDITIPRGEKTYVFTDLTDKVEGTPSYQWQILVDNEDNRWANILYYDAPYAALTESLLSNSRDPESGKMTIRCIVTSGESKYVSGTLDVNMPAVEEKAADVQTQSSTSTKTRALSAGNMARAGEGTSGNAKSDEAFQIEVSYVYWNNSPLAHDMHGEGAAETFTVTLLPSVAYDGQKNHPVIPGYKAYIRDDSATSNYLDYTALEDKYDETTEETHRYVEAQPIVFEHETEGRKVLIYYLPVEVTFRVNHYIQNLENDEYKLIQTDIKTGYSDYPVGENHQYTTADQYADIAGFTPLYYDINTRISANNKTEIDIYYDRNYYIVDFDLATPDGQKGYGVMPLYVRYGTQLMLSDPTAPGYAFTNWSFVQVYNRIENTVDGNIKITEEKIEDNAIIDLYDNPAAMLTIKHNVDYRANWQVATAYYTIAYWIESPESTDSTKTSNYGIWYTVSIASNTGSKTTTATNVYSETAFKNQLANMNTIATDNAGKNAEITAARNDVTAMYPYITYESDLSTKTAQDVNGDGSTVVNVYFSRKLYTLKFYYAIENNNKYYIIGGSSYDFGYETGGPIQGMRQYAPGGSKYDGATGQITAMPTLNAKGLSRPYTVSFDIDGNNKYHYISFTAKYGADTTNLWPCDVFNNSTRSSKNTHNKWSGTEAFVSSWNGENGIKYTQDHLSSNGGNGNLTIKGNYTQLDANLLWKNMSNTSTTVSYACFWENGADVDWSVPELYRYKIWLPTLDGVEYPATKVFNNFTYVATYDENNDGKPDYYLADCYDTCDDSDENGQTHPALTGYSTKSNKHISNLYAKNNYDSLTADEKKQISRDEYNAICEKNSTYRKLYKEAWIMNFFYTRSTHNIFYDDQNGKDTFESVPFGASLNTEQYRKPTGPDYPSAFEVGEYTFEGWYEDKACTITYVFDGKTMPDKNIKLYANWVKTTWDVVVYQEEPTDDNPTPTILAQHDDVPFGTLLTTYGSEPERTAPVDGYIFAGWYYVENGVEKRFDFNTMAIKHDYEIYAKWTSEVPVEYTVRYVAVDADGNEIAEIADQTKGVSLAGISKSFMAKVDKELYDGYQTGYFPVSREQTFKMSEKKEDNVITFKYEHSNKIEYKITHVFTSPKLANYTKDRSETLTLEWTEHVTESNSALLTVSFRDLIVKDTIRSKLSGLGYSSTAIDNIWNEIISLSPDAYSKRLILEAHSNNDDHDNEIIFHWEGRSDKVVYEVHHLYESLDGTGYDELSDPQVFEVVYPGTAIYEQIPIKGFVFEKHTTNNKNNSLALIKPQGTQEGLIINVYYKRETYNYTIKFYDDELYTPISGVEQVNKTGKYGEIIKISDVAEDIDGYDLSNGADEEELIFNNQEIICYYKRQSVKYEYILVGVGGSLNNFQEEVAYGNTPKAVSLTIISGYIVQGWEYSIDGGEFAPVTNAQATVGVNGSTLQPVKPELEDMGKTIYFRVTLTPTTFTITNAGNLPADQAFIYVITNNADGQSVRVTVMGNTSTTIQGMPEGNYNVTLENNWSWRYENDDISVPDEFAPSIIEYSWNFDFSGEEEATITYSNPNENYVSTNANSTNKE